MTREEGENGRDDMEIDGTEQAISFPEEFNINYLRFYYGKLFPFADIAKWMSYGNDGKHPNIYMRYQSFNAVTELESSIKEKCPVKIDIGAVYSVDPAKRLAYNEFAPVERELVFDIDISDYDDVRYCCSEADVCLDCWPVMTVVIKVLDTALRADFGFNHILWVYSGRRGVHCWVCDEKARRLTDDQRSAIADYFRVYKGNENNVKKVSLTGQAIHPFLAQERYEKILAMIPDESVSSELRRKWQNSRRSSKEDINVARWDQLKHVLQSGKQKAQGLRRCVEEIVLTYTFPRIDMGRTAFLQPLFKSCKESMEKSYNAKIEKSKNSLSW